MALKDYATGTVATAPSPATSGTSLILQTGEGARMPATPFYATAHLPSVFPTLDNAEKIQVTNIVSDTLTIVRAQGGTTAQSIDVGWRISNAIFKADLPSAIPVPVADGGTAGTSASTARSNLGAAPVAAKYIVQTADSELSAEQALGALATGILKNTTTTGVLSIATEGTDYWMPGGTDVTVADGGTGSSTAAGARTNLGLVIGTDIEAHDADLTTIAGLAPSNDDVVQRKAGAWTNRTMAQLAADLKVEIGKLHFPVGTYYINETDSTDPATLLGFGTWSAVTDKFIVGHGSTYTATGGSATHTHPLSTNGWAQIAMGSGGTLVSNRKNPVTAYTETHHYTASGTTNSAVSGQINGTTLDGATDAGSTIPPYQAAYIWKRTA